MTITTGVDRVLNGQAAAQRPNQILGNPYGDRSSISRYLNPAAFAQPDLGTIGNMHPFNIEGPGYWQLDMALARTFQIRESQRLEFRAEAFNLTNTFIPKDPLAGSLSFNSNTFGQITTSGDARVMQFALRYAF